MTLRVETAADGSGTLLPAQNVVAGSSITAYAIARDAFNNFVDNQSADSGGWALTNLVGGVASGDLVPAEDRRSAIFTGRLVGSVNIVASVAFLSSTASGLISVVPAVASRLALATAPSASAMAGIAFVQQPVVLIEDQYGNVRSNDTPVVTATRSGGAGTLQGVTNVTAVGGVASFSNLAHTYATNITITFNSGSLASVESGSITVGPGAFSQLQLLVPGESAAPATVTGNTGVPLAQTADNSFTVTVNAVDSYWNLVNTVGDTVAISATDPNATIPANAALNGGTRSFSVKLNTAGTRTVTATDVS